MIQPAELKKSDRLLWSPGSGTDVWAMLYGCAQGDLASVQRLLAKDPSLVRCHYQYRKPLYFAVRENQIAVAEMLLERDPNPTGLDFNADLLEIASDRGYTQMRQMLEAKLWEIHGASQRGESLAAAICSQDLVKVRAILDSAPDLLHVGDARGNRPIHWAVMTRQINMIDELLRRGADINARRIDGARPIQLTNGDYHFRGWRDVAADHSTTSREVLDHLRSRGAYCDICTAAFIGDRARVEQLLDGDASLANRAAEYVSYYACSGTPIRNAAAAGQLEVVELLLQRGADPNLPEEGIAPRGHALYSAAANGHYEVAKLLLEHGAHPNAEVESSADTLSRVLSNDDPKMLELLCSHGAARAVHLLAYYNDLQTAAAVFAANPTLTDDPDALANAAAEGHEAFVQLLLRYRPDLPRRVQFPGWSVGAKTRELNELLFRHGMDANVTDWLGVTPLHQFARAGDLEKAAIFLEHGADINARDLDICSTPLGWAAKFGQEPMVEFLLQRGADPDLPGPSWASPRAWANRRGHSKIVERLNRHAGK